jgi:hypothetical protein
MTIMTDMEALGAIARGENVPQPDLMRPWREGLVELEDVTPLGSITPSYHPTCITPRGRKLIEKG